MKRRIFAIFLSLAMLLTLVPAAWAEDGESSESGTAAMNGTCGAMPEDKVTWALADDDGDGFYTLTISGSGAMADYAANINNNAKAKQPWRASETGVEIEKITKVVVSENITSIGAFAFNGMTGVSEYVIGADVNTISQWALETSAAKVFNLNGNTKFKTDDNGVLFNEGGTTLIAYPGGADVRDEYTVPSTVTAISDGAFVGCPIKKLTIGDNVKTELPGWSFNGGVLEELDVNCLFGKSTFAQITTLKKVTLGGSITEIPQMAFLDCEGLQTVSIPSGLTKIGAQAFFGCSSLQNVTLPASLKEIGYQAFRDCDALTSITFPDDLEKLGEQAFLITEKDGHTGSLTTVTFGTNVPSFLKPDGKESTNPQLFTGQNQIKTVDMSQCETKVISAGLFNGLTSLETINFPTGMTEIGDNAFTNCKGLKSLEFPDSLTKIGESAFSGCTGLTYISYGSGIDDIGRNAFGGCTNVKVIDLHRATKIGEKYNNGSQDDDGDPALTHACIAAAHNVKYYLRTTSQASSVKGNLEWGNNVAGGGNISNTYYILTAKDAVPDYTGQTDTPTRAGYTFKKWNEVTVNEGSTTTKNVYTDADSWSLASPTVTVSPASANTYVNDSAVTLTAKVSEPVHGFNYSYQWYSNTSSSTEGGTAISDAINNTYSPIIATAGTTYYYCVVTVKNGSGTASATTAVVPVTVAKQAGSVTISNDKTTATYGDKPFTFTYTANKAATVTSSNPSVATVQENNGAVTVTIVGAGTTEISVSFDADTNYSAASDKFTLTVTKATPSISISATPDTLTGSGTVKLTVTGAPTTEGSVKVTCDNDITVTPNNEDGTFSATLPNQTKTYTFKASYTGAENGNYSDRDAQCTVTVTRRSSGSSSTRYAVTTPSTKNGDVTVSPKNASKGDRVTITVKPDSGYEIGTVTVKDRYGASLKLTDKGNGKYTFTMPDGQASVSATFNKAAAQQTFKDVPANTYYADAVAWAVKKGITNGVGNDLFGSDNDCTRAEIVTFLWRAAGSPEPKGTGSFTDVNSGSYYAKAVAWAVENGITEGTGNSQFSPDKVCSRAQAVTFLARALSAKAASAADFTDVPANSYYADAVGWAAKNGVTEGVGGGKFAPNNDCTRAQIVTFLYRAYQGK